MKKSDLIKQCRYYNGENESPYTGHDDMSWFWDMERVYVESNGDFEGEGEYYKAIKGKEYPGIPYTLLIIMFTSWGKWTSDMKGNIDQFYKLMDDYLFIPNDHYPEDKIPG